MQKFVTRQETRKNILHSWRSVICIWRPHLSYQQNACTGIPLLPDCGRLLWEPLKL